MEKDNNEILSEINSTLKKINHHIETDEMFSESKKLIEQAERRVENSVNQIQATFDRIHDKVFNFNNILISVYLALGVFPNESPKIDIWNVVFPILNLIYLVYLEFRQMEIHRFTAKELEWTSVEREKYRTKVSKQSLLSLLSLLLSVACVIYLVIKLN